MRGRYDKELSFYIDEGSKIQYQVSGTILNDLRWTFSVIHKYQGVIAGGTGRGGRSFSDRHDWRQKFGTCILH
jgi:hypothetical protein